MARVALVHALVLAAMLLVTHESRAQVPGEAVTVVDPLDIPPENDPLAHAWELPGQRGGFYFRGSIALGVHNVRFGPAAWEDEESGRTANGFGTNYGVDLGGFVRPWVALHVDSQIGVLWSADLENDIDIVGADDRPDVRVLTYGVAPAATFITANGFFFKPAFGVGFATTKQGSASRTSDPGFYMHLVAGKDVYVDRHFAVGLQFDITYMRLNDDSPLYEARTRQFLFGVSFAFDSL